MLVLTRRTGESIIINDDIELKILRIKGRQVHVGIDAPMSTAVHRKEVWQRIRGHDPDLAPANDHPSHDVPNGEHDH